MKEFIVGRSDGGNAVEFIHEDNHLLAACKPCGMPSQPDASGDESLDAIAKQYLKVKYAKPGDVYLGLLHRLDRPTSGVVVMARTDKAASRMAALFRNREIDKAYLALVECVGKPKAADRLRDWLEPLDNGGMRVTEEKTARAREARLAYRLLGMSGDGGRALLEITLETGVKHQIRCQLAARGLPVTGDFRYGAFGKAARPEPVLNGGGVLLHAWRVGFVHPVRKERLELTAGAPEHWRKPLAGIAGVDAEALLS